MQQTLLAISAVAAFAYLALGQQKTDHHLDQRGTVAAVELAAVDLAQARMDVLVGMAFDEQDIAAGGVRHTPATSLLGPDAGEAGPDFYDDLDDWNGYDAPATVAVGSGTLAFRETVTVRYVVDDAPATPSAGATLSKELVVTIEELLGGDAARPPARATLQRVVTPVGLAIDHDNR